ncbi:MAG: 16S rRNA (uracil(1498)-N(3))-methyltransferase [Alphaproteobacteria bacterium]|nr:16S rRNA (uracil(1498)-N(3))-methyltransferase [Alphaproteobacteria bacterium]MCB9985855.1 16S rRNA (uracil(1498)-N(3))-methyltransferase [Micavibrio sp.]
MSASDFFHLPRLHVSAPLVQEAAVTLSEAQGHYLRHVMRLESGAQIRLFNQEQGEWLGTLECPSKKLTVVQLLNLLRAPEVVLRQVHLVFSPIKKDRMDWLIEKAVELGVTDLHPVLMRRSVMRDIKVERVEAQIVEAAEQCERLDIPRLYPLESLPKFLKSHDGEQKIYAALERREAPVLSEIFDRTLDPYFYMIGPEGGFDPEEITLLCAQACIVPVSLGARILRAETAALFGLSSFLYENMKE